jgi:hypothetical protein
VPVWYLDLTAGMISSLLIYHIGSICNLRSSLFYLQNYNIKTEALPTYFRGIKHSDGFFSATPKFPVLFLPLIFKGDFRRSFYLISTKKWDLILPGSKS